MIGSWYTVTQVYFVSDPHSIVAVDQCFAFYRIRCESVFAGTSVCVHMGASLYYFSS